MDGEVFFEMLTYVSMTERFGIAKYCHAGPRSDILLHAFFSCHVELVSTSHRMPSQDAEHKQKIKTLQKTQFRRNFKYSPVLIKVTSNFSKIKDYSHDND